MALFDLQEFRSERRQDDRDGLLGGIAGRMVGVASTPDVYSRAVALGRLETGAARFVEGAQDSGCGFVIVCHACVYDGSARSFHCPDNDITWRRSQRRGLSVGILQDRRDKSGGAKPWRRGPSQLAPGEGFEPPAKRLTAACSTTELPGINDRFDGRKILPAGGGAPL
jgi:hypothetical protein